MNKITLSAFVLTTVLGATSVACSSAPAERVDADTTLASFQNPTGSFSKDSAGSAFSGYQSEKGESSKVQSPGAGAAGTRPQSIKLLTRTLDAKAQCAEGQACACPSGGSFTYALESSKAGQALRFAFDKCVSEDRSGFDGEALLLVGKQPLLGVAAKAPGVKNIKGPEAPAAGSSSGLKEAQPSGGASPAEDNILFAARGTAFEGSQSLQLEFAIVYEAGYLLAAVSVPDGKVVVGLAPDRTVFVQAKQGAWVCTPNGARYTCKGQGGEATDLDLDDAPALEGSTAGGDKPAQPTQGSSASAPGAPADDFDF